MQRFIIPLRYRYHLPLLHVIFVVIFNYFNFVFAATQWVNKNVNASAKIRAF